MQWILIRKLKSLKSWQPDPRAHQEGLLRLEEVMRLMPMRLPPVASVRAFAWRPAFGALLVVVVLTTSGGVVYAAQDALPGEALYGVKIAAEAAGAKFAVSDDARLQVAAKRAERRLAEAGAILKLEELPETERDERVRVTMERYELQVFAMNEAALAHADARKPGKKEEGRRDRAAKAAVRVLERHEALVDSATGSVAERLVLESVRGSLEFEADVRLMVPASFERPLSEELRRALDERGGKLRERLKRYEDERDDSRETDQKEDPDEDREREPDAVDESRDRLLRGLLE